MSYWISFDHTQEPPWIITTEPVGDTCRGLYTHEQASRRIARLAPMWNLWIGLSTLKLMHHEKGRPEGQWEFTEEEYGEAYNRVLGHRQLRVAINDLRMGARQYGLNPDDVVFQKGEWPDAFVCAGPLIASMPPRVGRTYRPKDPRRKGSFTVTRIEDNWVHGDDGRRVHLSRWRRYQRVVEGLD